MNNKHRNWPNWTVGLRDTLFRLACLNRGFPVRLGDETFRIDESLRRHKIDSDDFLFVALKNTLRPGDVFVDVGANIGLYSLAASPLVGKTGVVQSFEPDPTNVALLSRNIYLNSLGSTVIAQGIALSETSIPSTLEFFVPLDGKGSPESSLQPGSKPMKKVEVPTTTLDEFVESFGRVPTLIKIDTEGAELPILKGAERLLRQSKPNLIVEYHGGKCEHFGYTTNDLWNHLTDLGYDQKYLMKENDGYFMTFCKPKS